MELNSEQKEWLENYRMSYLNNPQRRGPVREVFCDKGPFGTPGYLEAGFAVQNLPDKLKTEALCLAAVRENALAWEYVPQKLKAKVKAAFKKEE